MRTNSRKTASGLFSGCFLKVFYRMQLHGLESSEGIESSEGLES